MKMLNALFLFLIFGPMAMGQSFSLNEASGNYASAGIGINIGAQNFYNSYILKNTAAINPSMQPPIIATTITVASGSATTFTDGDIYAGFAANQFAGMPYEVRCAGNQFSAGIQVCTGGSFGRTGTVISNTATSGSGTTFTVASGAAFAAQDTVVVRQSRVASTTANNFNAFGWNASGVTIDTTSGDLPAADPSGYSLVQVMKVSGTGSMSTNFDTTNGFQYYAFNGTYSIAINYKISSGSSCPISWSVQRSVTSGAAGVNASGTITTVADGAWHTGTATFTASEPNTLNNNLSTITYSGASGCVTLWYGSQDVRTSDTNTSVYRDHVVVTDFGTIKPAEVRYWAGQNGETLDNWIATQNYRSDSSAIVPSNVLGVQQGLYDFLNAAVINGWKAVEIVVPITFDNTDVSHLVDFIAGGSGTTYGAKRIALGTSAGFNTLIHRIVLEVGNEVWNGSAANENMPTYNCASTSGTCWNYMPIAASICGSMKANGNWDSTHMACAAGMPAGGGSPQFYTQLTQQIDTSHNIDAFALNQYTIQSPTACTPTNLYQTWWQQYWQNTHSSSDALGWYQGATQAATTGATTYPYEYQNNLTGGGSCTSGQIAGQAEGEGEALADVLGPAWDQQIFGTKDGTFFTLYQPNYGSNNIWGITTGAGGAYQNPRVSAQAIGVFNACAAGTTGYAATGSSIPTFNFTGINGINSANNVPTLFAFPFMSGSTRCVALFNMDPTTSRTVSLAGTNAPSGMVTETALTSTNVTDNNEGANAALVVQPSTSTVSNPSSFTLTPHSMMTVEWTVSAAPTPGPINFGVTFAGINN